MEAEACWGLPGQLLPPHTVKQAPDRTPQAPRDEGQPWAARDRSSGRRKGPSPGGAGCLFS